MQRPQHSFDTKEDFDRIVRTLSTFDVGSFDYVNKQVHALLAVEAKTVVAASYIELVPYVSVPCETVTVLGSTLRIMEDDV